MKNIMMFRKEQEAGTGTIEIVSAIVKSIYLVYGHPLFM